MDTSVTASTLEPSNQQPSLQPKQLNHTKKYTRYGTYILGAIICILIGIAGTLLYLQQTNTTNTARTTETEPVSTTSEEERILSNKPNVSYSIRLTPNTGDTTAHDVYIRNSNSGEESFFLTIPDVHTEHFSPAQYHQETLYIIRRIYQNSESNTWKDELWKYKKNNDPKKLFSGQAFTFIVSANQRYIAVNTDNTLTFLDQYGTILKNIQKAELAPEQSELDVLTIQLLDWSSDQDSVWGTLTQGPYAMGIFRVTTSNWSSFYQSFDTPIGKDFALNPDSSLVAFSDYPVFFDVDSAKRFEESKTLVSLYLFDLRNQTSRTIAVSFAKVFNPVWIDNTKLEHNDPNGSNRTLYSVDSQSDNSILPTTNWKVYSDSSKGYSLRYPTEWTQNTACIGGFPNETYPCFKSPNLTINQASVVTQGELVTVATPGSSIFNASGDPQQFCNEVSATEQLTMCETLIIDNKPALKKVINNSTMIVGIIQNNRVTHVLIYKQKINQIPDPVSSPIFTTLITTVRLTN